MCGVRPISDIAVMQCITENDVTNSGLVNCQKPEGMNLRESGQSPGHTYLSFRIFALYSRHIRTGKLG